MDCPVCGCATRITETRSMIDHVVRRRKCIYCGHVWFTEEIDSVRAEDELRAVNNKRAKQYYRNKKTAEAIL